MKLILTQEVDGLGIRVEHGARRLGNPALEHAIELRLEQFPKDSPDAVVVIDQENCRRIHSESLRS